MFGLVKCVTRWRGKVFVPSSCSQEIMALAQDSLVFTWWSVCYQDGLVECNGVTRPGQARALPRHQAILPYHQH